MEMSVELLALAALSLGKISCIHGIGGWMGPTAGLDVLER